jgi:hypothetical protein
MGHYKSSSQPFLQARYTNTNIKKKSSTNKQFISEGFKFDATQILSYLKLTFSKKIQTLHKS